MLDLVKMFLEDKNKEYYSRFDIPEKYQDEFGFEEEYKFLIFDDKEAIQKFKDYVKPPDNSTTEQSNDFILLCYYLNKQGYYITEFPEFLERPTNLYDFSYNKVRTKIQKETNDYGAVRWAERRSFVDSMTFKKRTDVISVNIKEDINELFVKVSTRNAEFENMTADEKLQHIKNILENLLKDKGYKNVIFEDLTMGYISSEQVLDFSKKLQCFRHGSEESLNERKSYSDDEKQFMIDYGLTILAISKRYIDKHCD